MDYTIEHCVQSVKRLRDMRYVKVQLAFFEECNFCSPLYEMVKEGIDLKTIQWSQH